MSLNPRQEIAAGYFMLLRAALAQFAADEHRDQVVREAIVHNAKTVKLETSFNQNFDSIDWIIKSELVELTEMDTEPEAARARLHVLLRGLMKEHPEYAKRIRDELGIEL